MDSIRVKYNKSKNNSTYIALFQLSTLEIKKINILLFIPLTFTEYLTYASLLGIRKIAVNKTCKKMTFSEPIFG